MGYQQRATPEDALYIAKNLREADRQECDALLALPPELVLPQATASPHCWTIHTSEGEPVVIYGVDPVPGDDLLGTVWMCSTPKLIQHRVEFLRSNADGLAKLHEDFPILTNYVDARNTLHHRWLRWLGFAFLRRIEKWGARSVPFYEFARMKT